MDSFRTPLDLVDWSVGPVEVAVTPDRVAQYVNATDADTSKWTEAAPPGFASVVLFAAADEFLYHPDVIAYTATLLHLDQSFTYLTPMRVGSAIRVEGTVTRVRERAGSYFVTFDATAADEQGPVVESRSTFVLSDQKASQPEVTRSEPHVRERAMNSGSERSASRYDLVRYAAATRDFNPLHWDHDFAVDSGLPGTVVHGLLMYAWMVQCASVAGGGREVTSAKIRFRAALHPSQQATITSSVSGDSVAVSLTCDDAQLVTGTVSLLKQGT